MKIVGLFAAFVLLVTAPALGQTVRGDRFTLNTGPCTIRSGSGNPEGAVVGVVCDTYHRTDTPFTIYYKTSGSGNTGWTALGTGTVTSVGLSMPSQFAVTNSPVTSSGTLTANWNTQTANFGLFGPATGSAAAPTFRALVRADVPFGAALTKADDTNITATLGGSPATALLDAVSLTLGWTGTLAVPRGGTGSASLTANGVVYGAGTAAVGVTAQGAANSVLAGNAGVPAFTATPTVTTVTTTSNATVGSSGAGAFTYVPAAPMLNMDTGVLRQRAVGQTGYGTEWYPSGSAGVILNSYSTGGAGAWQPINVFASQVNLKAPTTITGLTTVNAGGLNIGTTGNPGIGNVRLLSGLDYHIGTDNYFSEYTGWRIDGVGSADFRYVYTNELVAKSFIADLEQALAGSQIIAKSVTKLASLFVAPSAGSATTLTVSDLPSADGMAVFESGDYIRIRTFSRASGSLSITDCWGVVTSYADGPDSTQTWTFTRSSVTPGAMAATTVVAVDSIVIDYGTTGNGFHEVNAIDGLNGINSPYSQIATTDFTTASGFGPTYTLRTRLGNLRGVTGVTGEYGLIAGTYGTASAGKYLRLSNTVAEFHNIPIKMYSSAYADPVIRVSPFSNDDVTTSPNIALGTPAPDSFGSAAIGYWAGLDAGIFKWRVGNPAGGVGAHYISWNGTQLTVSGNIVVTGTSIDASSVGGVAAATINSGVTRANEAITSANGFTFCPPVTGCVVAAPSGTGLFLGSDYMGYFTGGNWTTYFRSNGNFALNGTTGSNYIFWNGTVLTVAGAINITSGSSGYSNFTDEPTSLAMLDSAQNTKLVGIAAGATVGATWSTNLTGIPSTLQTPSGTGLFLSSTYMGYYSGGVPTTYMDVNGNFQLGTTGVGGTGMAWDQLTGALTVRGTVNATAGNIGGWTLSANAFTSGSTTSTVGLRSDGATAIFAGDATPASAPFRVTAAGALTATNATITGTITASGGLIGSFTIGTYLYTGSKTAYNDANAGIHLGADGIGIGNNAFTVSSTGALVATNATITGAITSSSVNITGGTLAISNTTIDSSGIRITPSTSHNDARAYRWANTNIGGINGIYSADDGTSRDISMFNAASTDNRTDILIEATNPSNQSTILIRAAASGSGDVINLTTDQVNVTGSLVTNSNIYTSGGLFGTADFTANTGTVVVHNANGYYYDQSSSERVKHLWNEDWKPTATNRAAFLRQPSLLFSYRSNPGDPVIGFSAEKWEQARDIPFMVNYDARGRVASYRQDAFLVYTHDVQQDHDARIRQLEAEIASLKAGVKP